MTDEDEWDVPQDLPSAAVWWAERGFAVFPLQPRGKDPLDGSHGFKDATRDVATLRKWWSRAPEMNIGLSLGAPSGGVFALDLDAHDEGADGRDTLAEWEAEHGDLPDTLEVRTGSGGIHLLFRSDSTVRPSANAQMAVDVRGDGSYIVAPPSVHPNGVRYAIVHGAAVADADDSVRAFVEVVRPAAQATTPGGFVDFERTIEQGGRDDAVYRKAASCRAKSLDREDAVAVCLAYNASKCKPPLPESQVRAKVASAYRKPAGHSAEYEARRGGAGGDEGEQAGEQDKKPYLAKNGIKHVQFAKVILKKYSACYIDGVPAVFVGGRWKMGWFAVEGAMIDEHPPVTDRARQEVRKYLAHVMPHVEQSPDYLIGFENCVLDLRTGEEREWSPDLVIPNVIPHEWHADARCDVVDATIRKMAAGDDVVAANIGEVVGLSMMRSARYMYAAILLGVGSNGKSTFIDMLKALIGHDNASVLQPSEVGKRFRAASLIGKLVNLSDDISNDYLDSESCAQIKKIVGGSEIETDVKGKDPIRFVPYCTMIMSANEMPGLADTSWGMVRRLMPIPFKAQFSPQDPDFDPHIADKLTSEEACERLCVIGASNAAKIIERKGITLNPTMETMRSEIELDNSSVLQWIRENNYSQSDVDGRTVAEVYEEYVNCCEHSGIKPLGKQKFNRKLKTYWLNLAQIMDHDGLGSARKTVWRWKLDYKK